MRCRKLLLALSLLPCVVHAQTALEADTLPPNVYAFVLHVGGGASLYPGPMGVPSQLSTHAEAMGWAGNIRLMWHPDHRLRVGLESGRVHLYDYSIDGPPEAGKVDLSAIPLLLVWSMPITKHLSIYAGYGTYLLQSDLDYYGRVRSHKFSLGYSATISYLRPISPTLALGAEAEWMNAAETRNTVLTFQAHLAWQLFHW